ncbi:MAG: 3-deoxy-D-manno-octulosonate 8-phosphate phosphatase [Bacteroidetes bacterium]|nr:3-deoxy-D-manno-octulosonate 8-phosphate phosphatase [Bacteroidota bacterium]
MLNIPSLESITAFIFDMDGVLTDGNLLLGPDQMQLRTMNVKDGFALQLAVKKGYIIIIISGAESLPAMERLNKLGISEVHMGVQDKEEKVLDLLKQYELDYTQVLYMGDDLPDLAVMKKCGIASCPADAVPEIKSIAHIIASNTGGKGCVREILEKVMRARGDWEIDALVRSI